MTTENRPFVGLNGKGFAVKRMVGVVSSKNAGLYAAGADSLFIGLLVHRLNSSNEAVEKRVESGKIRASHLDGECYRITEPAVRVFSGKF